MFMKDEHSYVQHLNTTKGLDPYWVLNVSITSAWPMSRKPDISPRGERTLAIKSINNVEEEKIERRRKVNNM